MNRPTPTRRWGLPVFVAASILAVGLPQILTDTAETPNTPDLAPGEAGLRAAIDPETGELAVGADAMRLQGDKAVDRELRESLSRSSEGLVMNVRDNGHATVHLQGRFMSTSVARVTPEGEVETLCTHDADEAEAFLTGEIPARPEVDAHGREVR